MEGTPGTTSGWALDRQEGWHSEKNTGWAVRMGSSPDGQPPIVQVTSDFWASPIGTPNVTTSDMTDSFLSVMLQITSTLRPWYQVYWLLCTSRSNTCQIFHGRGKKQYASRDGHLFIFLNSTFCTSQLLKHNGTILWGILWGSAAFAIAFQRLLRTLHPIITK